MSCNQINLALLILNEHFGNIVRDVGEYLMKHGPAPLSLILRELKDNITQVKLTLAVLIKHDWVTYEKNSQNIVMYKMNVDNVLLVLRYPRYIFCCKTLFGETAELLLEELLKHGQMLMSTAVQNVLERLKESGIVEENGTIESLKAKFNQLVQTQFVQRCPAVSDTGEIDVIPSFKLSEKEIFSVPEIPTEYFTQKRKRTCSGSESPPRKKAKVGEDPFPDESIFWKVNFDKFHQYFRDQAISSAISNRLNPQASEIIQTLLRLMEVRNDPWTNVTNPVAKYELTQELSKNFGIKPFDLDRSLAVLVNDSTGFLRKEGDSQGGLYVIKMKDAVTALAWATLESVVSERFGPKCYRIFRLLRLKKYLEQKQIEDMAMIPPKDAKEMTYKLFQENFIHFQEIPKTPEYAPSRTYFLFYIDLPQVARMVLEYTYKGIFNVKCREMFELKENKRTLEKKQKIDAIVASMQAQGAEPSQLQEVEELISPPERLQLERVKHIRSKLQLSEIQLDETVFTLQIYLRYAKET